MSAFYSYRIFLIEPKYLQQNLFEQQRTKEQEFYNVFDSIESKKRTEFSDWGTDHIIFHYSKRNDDIFIWEFCKKQDYAKPIAGKTRIEEIADTKYPYIFLIFNRKKQIVLVEKNTSVFQTLDISKSKLQRFLTNQLSRSGIYASLTEITDQKEFWEEVSELDMIENITLEYNPPNYFRGKGAFDKLVKETHEETNFKKFKIYLQNKVEGLKFQHEDFKEHIQRLAQGSGAYLVKGIKDGFNKIIESIDIPYKKIIDNVDQKSTEDLEQDFEDIEKLNEDE